jgi:hypothetical protein
MAGRKPQKMAGESERAKKTLAASNPNHDHDIHLHNDERRGERERHTTHHSTMVAINPSSRHERPASSWLALMFRGAVIAGAVTGGMILGEMMSLRRNENFQVSETTFYTPGLRTDAFDQCKFYLAESAIPHGGLGMFAGVGLQQGEQWGVDICLYVADTPHDTRTLYICVTAAAAAAALIMSCCHPIVLLLR